jgi:hypothetical protein
MEVSGPIHDSAALTLAKERLGELLSPSGTVKREKYLSCDGNQIL